LYLLPACAPVPPAYAPCNDDTEVFSSTISVDGLAAGDYFVVVDSAENAGGGFGVSVTVN